MELDNKPINEPAYLVFALDMCSLLARYIYIYIYIYIVCSVSSTENDINT